MANADRPRGARPYERANRESAYTAGGTVYPGDYVKMNSSGQIVVAAAGDALRGVAANYATSGATVNVWDDPNQKFTCQSSASLASTDVGLNADILATAGSSAYKMSRHELDGASVSTDTCQLRIVAVDPAIGNAAGAADVDVIVVINEHELRAATGV